MTGPEHFRAAEDHLDDAVTLDEGDMEASAWHQRQAQAHATLALAAATALNDADGGLKYADWAEWCDAAAVTS
jgi:hypothetical protein